MGDMQENSLPPPSPNQRLLSIDEELWLMAEERAQEILCIIRSNVISDVNRKEIIDYLQRLIGDYYGAEVFPFGSVPLKTYLPDGDIDLTVLSDENVEVDLAKAICDILGSGDDLEYEVKDIHYICAQVKVVKCMVKNIAVDISFNQVAGLYAMHFLEQVDQLVGKNHLFKRSIILIKAWCYYESRILGAHHGLLSTYALEILVLYIINRFHSSVHGPLEVLYRFLDYYKTFDWDSYYMTIDGPQAISSLPKIVEKPECDRVGLLLSKELLKNYRDMCYVPKASETTIGEFPTKQMNILDPLKHDNNLGRSVSRGNLHRITFALSFGARKLKEILTLPGESMGAALEMFFMNTLNRNGKGQRPDVDVPVPPFGTGRSEESVLVGDCDSYYDCLQYIQLCRNYAMPLTAHSISPSIPAQVDMLALQQNWCMFYQRGTDLYVPGQTFYHPNASQASYGLEELGKSRGTGTYIPYMTQNSYWSMHTRATKPRKFGHTKYSALPRSHQRKQPKEVHSEADMKENPRSFERVNQDFPIPPSIHNTWSSTSSQEEVHSETDMIGNSKSVELSNEDFRIFPNIHSTRSSTSQEEVYSQTDMNDNSRSFELSNEDFPVLPSVGNTRFSTSQDEVHSETDIKDNSRSFELSNVEFPILPSIRNTRSSTSLDEVHSETGMNRSFKLSNADFPILPCIRNTREGEIHSKTDIKDNSRSFMISNEDFPIHPSIRRNVSSASQESKQENSSSPSRINIEFGTYRISQSPAKLSLGREDQKEDSGVSSSQGTMPVTASR